MAKRKIKGAKKGQAHTDSAAPSTVTSTEPKARMKGKEYEGEMRRLHGELVAMQEWVKAIKVPKRQGAGRYASPGLPLKYIPTPF